MSDTTAAGELATEVIAALTLTGHTVATAESLTGGLVAAALTDVPGSSNAFRGGVVAYATELKAQLLGVDPGMLERYGPVHAPVAAAMANGRQRPPRRHDRRGHHGRRGPGAAGRPPGGHRARRGEPVRRHGGTDHGAAGKPGRGT